MVKRVALAIGAFVAVYVGCHEPTEIIVRVTTSFDCSLLASNAVTARFGTTVPLTGATSAVSTACANGYVGSLVLTPSPAWNGQSITVEVIAALTPNALDADGLCTEGAAGCIRARRMLPYLSGNALTVPIEIEASCAGVPCMPNQTCVHAQCVSSNVDPNQCDKTNCSLDGGADAGPARAACGDMSGLLANAALPMDKYCPGHVGYSPNAGPATTPTLVHQFPTGLTGPQPDQPAQVAIDENDDVYFLTLDGMLHAFSARTGTEKWPAWATQTGGLQQGVGSVLLASDGTLYVANDTQVIAVDRATGAQKDAVTVPDDVRSTLTPGPLGLYFSGPNRTVETIALNPLTMGLSTIPTTSAIDGVAPMMAGGSVWVGDGQGKAWAFDATSLAGSSPLTINQSLGGLTTMSAAPDGTIRTCYIGGGEGGVEGVVASFSSTLSWARNAGAAVQCFIVAVTSDGTTLYSDDNRSLYAFDSKGDPPVQYPGNHPRYPAVDANGTVYTIDPSSNLVAYASPTSTKWSSAIQMSPWVIYVGTDHDLIAVSDTEIDVLK